jgi:integrase
MAVQKYFSKLLGRETWGYDARIRGKRRHKIGFSTKPKAEEALLKARIAANERAAGVGGDAPPVTVKRLVASRIKQIGDATYTRRQAAKVLNAWLEMLPDDLTAGELTTAHIALYRDARLTQVKPQTVSREISDIMGCLNSAHERHAELSEWRAPRRPKLKTFKGWRTVIITPEQIAQLLSDLRRPKEPTEQRREYRARLDAADFFQVALLTLGRKGEVRRLSWRDVNWKTKRLRIDSLKTGAQGEIEMSDGLVEILARRRAAQDSACEWVFPSDQNPQQPLSRFRTEILRRAAERCGIPWGYKEPHGIVLHTTRHTSVTALLAAGHDLATAQAKSRHSTRQLLMRYGHTQPERERAATQTLDQFSVSALAAISVPKMPLMPHQPRLRRRKKMEKTKAKSA